MQEKRFTDIFIQRPVFATCISLIILLIGIVSFTHMSVRQYPKIDASVINVSVSYPGAPADVMEGFVATPLEEAVSKVDGIDYVTSSSTQGTTSVVAHFKLGYDIDKAMTDVSAEVNAVRNQLPEDIYPPVISKKNPNAMPILFFAFKTNGKYLDSKQLTDYLIRVVQPQMQTVSGVGEAPILGGKEYAMRIWLNPKLMAAKNVTGADIYNSIKNQNVIAPAGVLKSKFQQITLHGSTELNTAKEFNDLVIRNTAGSIVRIKDVGKAELGAQDYDFSVNINGQSGIFLAVSPKANANILNVREGISKLLPSIKDNLPKGVSFSKLYDATKFIKASISEVSKTIIEAAILVFIIIFFMIGSFRSVLIPIVTIPLSLTGACIIMLALGFSINTLTLLAAVLAIGLVVDDAIVVLENIHRHLESGLTPKKAALTGAREISFAVIAMTLTLFTVYIPIGFVGGLTGQLFTEFAFTLAAAVIISGFVALTLSPMMCSRLYKSGANLHAGLSGVADNFFDKLHTGYKKILTGFIKYKYLVMVFAILCYVGCYFLYGSLQQELAPKEDVGAIATIVFAPPAANLEYTQNQTEKFVNIYKRFVPEMKDYFIVNGFPMGINSAFSLVILKDWDKRKRTSKQIQQALFGPMWSIPGIESLPFIPSSLPGTQGMGQPVQMILSTTGSYEHLEKEADKFVEEISRYPGVTNVRSTLKINTPEINIKINRNQASILGVKMDQISLNLNTFLSKPLVNYFNMRGRGYEVLPRLYRKYMNIPYALNNLNVRTKSGALVPLSNLVSLEKTVIPNARSHFQQLRSTTVSASLVRGVSLGTALSYLTSLAHKTLSKDIRVNYASESRQFIESNGVMMMVMIFALFFIYLVLSAQFESFKDPFIIMLSVPLAITGALIGLHIFGYTLNIYTKIGLLTLMGLITKNGILIVEFANQNQRKGVPFHQALLDGAAKRLRPILMTTCAIVLGAVPLALASGAGAISRKEIGIVIIFGMSIGTLFTLFIIPTAYSLIASKKKAQK